MALRPGLGFGNPYAMPGTVSRPLIIGINTTLAGSAIAHFDLGCATGQDLDIDWGDGNIEHVPYTFLTVPHDYATPGLYDIAISEHTPGSFTGLFFDGLHDCAKVKSVRQWGTYRWADMGAAFEGCSHMDNLAGDAPVTGSVTNFAYAFDGCTFLTNLPALDTRSALYLNYAFRSTGILASFPLIDTRNVLDAGHAWEGCGVTSFPSLDLSACVTLAGAWANCANMTSFGAIACGACANFNSAWYGCSNLGAFPSLDMHSATDLTAAWYNCGSNVGGLAGATFPAMDWHNVASAKYMMLYSGINKASYNRILHQLAYGDGGSIPANVNTGVNFWTGSSHYDAGPPDGVAAHNLLTGTRGWTIYDGGTP